VIDLLEGRRWEWLHSSGMVIRQVGEFGITMQGDFTRISVIAATASVSSKSIAPRQIPARPTNGGK